jgi:ABC-type transporter Mla maintaining outer membrane lipid asymmetry permease subunit MlaE
MIETSVAAARFTAAATGTIGFLKKKQQLSAIGLMRDNN